MLVWSGVLARVAVALVAAAAFTTPLVELLARPDVSWGQRAVLLALPLALVVRPAWGVILVAVLVPNWLGLSVAFPGLSSTPLADALVLAVAAGFAMSLVWPRPGHAWGRLAAPAAVLGVAIVTSAWVELDAQAAVAPARPFWSELGQHLWSSYWTEAAQAWLVVHDALRWCALLVIAASVERVVRPDEQLARSATWCWVASFAVATTFTLVRVAEIVARRESGFVESIVWLVTTSRISALHPDLNAAGSIFGWFVVAAVLIAARRRSWWMAAGALPLLATGFALARSRAAVASVILVLLGQWWRGRRARHRPIAVVVLAACLVGVSAGAWMLTSRSHGAFGTAMALRVQMTAVGLRMVSRFWDFGVGLSDYARTSRRFVRDDEAVLAGFAPGGENAHNNFLQILVELGAPAAAAFLWLVLPAAAAGWRAHASPESAGVSAGLTAFLLSAIFGHPLLIPEVAALGFLGLGLAAGLAREEVPRSASRAGWIGAGFFVASLIWRLR